MCRDGTCTLKVNWWALQASSLMCITDSLCDLDFMILIVLVQGMVLPCMNTFVSLTLLCEYAG